MRKILTPSMMKFLECKLFGIKNVTRLLARATLKGQANIKISKESLYINSYLQLNRAQSGDREPRSRNAANPTILRNRTPMEYNSGPHSSVVSSWKGIGGQLTQQCGVPGSAG